MSQNSFNASLRAQRNVIFALILREARTRYGRRKLGYLWALVEPVLHMSMFAALAYFASRAVPIGDSMLMFLMTGLATFFGFRNVMGRTQGGYGANQALLSFPIVQVMDVFLARALLDLVTWMAVTILLMSALILAGDGQLPYNVLMMITAIAALFCMAFGFGVVIGIISEFMPSFSVILRLPMRLLYFTSGVFFLPDDVFPRMRDVIQWNPVMHGITLFRMGYYKFYQSHIFSPFYLASWAVGAVLVAFVVEKIARRAMRNSE